MNYNFIFLSVFIFLINVAQGIEIISSTFVKKEVNVLGVDLSYALIDIEFDKEIYKYDSLSCPNYNCTDPISKIDDCSCDYTDPNECPKKLPPSCTNICQLTSHDIDLCGQEANWITIEFEKEYTFTIDKLTGYRIKADPFGCKGVFLKVTPLIGYCKTYIGPTPKLFYQRFTSQFISPKRVALFNICPSDNWDPAIHYTFTESWTRDTYFINIEPQTQSFTFTMILHTNDVPMDSTNKSNCKIVSTDHICVTTGEVVISEVSQYFSYTVEKEGFYYFNFPGIYESVSYYISNSTLYPSPTNYQWALEEEYENFMVLYLQKSTIYIAPHRPLTNYTFSITDSGDRYIYSLSSLSNSIQGGALSLLNTALLVLPNGVDFYSSQTFQKSKDFSILYPQTDINPLFPVPIIFDNSQKFDSSKIINNISYSTFKPNSFQAAFVLYSSTNNVGKDNLKINQKYETIANSTIQFLSNLFDANDNPISFVTKLNVKTLQCNGYKFDEVVQQLDSINHALLDVIDIDELNNYRYTVYMLAISDAWNGCRNSALELLEMKNIELNISTKICQYTENSYDYTNSPCCNSNALGYKCCNPSIVATNVTQYQVNKSMVKNQCFSLDCTSSVLLEFSNLLAEIDDCAVSETEPIKLQLYSTTVLRDCKSLLITPYCNNDNDCGYKKCDLYTRTCLPDIHVIDKSYVQCVLSNLTPDTLYSLIGSTNVNQSIFDSVYNKHIKQDCIGHYSINDRSTYSWVTTSPLKPNVFCYPINCIDESCLTNHGYCSDKIDKNEIWDFKLTTYTQNCNERGVCPHLKCDKDGKAIVNGIKIRCKEACNSISQFCGYCTNNETICHVVPSITTQPVCDNQPICLLSNGNYLLNTTDKLDCQSKGECSVPCGYECTSNLVNQLDNFCLILSITNETKCNEMNNPTLGITKWSFENETCIYLLASTQKLCFDQSYTWIDCKSKPNGGCVGPSSLLNICSLKPISCKTKEECLNSGICSDQFYFDPVTTNNYNYPLGLGKCVDYTRNSFCYSDENDSPNGCYPSIPVHLGQYQCESQGRYYWWVPTRTRDECTSQMGCRFLESQNKVYNLPFNYHFNEMDQIECEGCFDSFNKWTNKFEWTPGKWIPGIYGTTKWLNNSFIPNAEVNVFDYQSFYQSVMAATRVQVSVLFRTEYYCYMERMQSNLKSISCSCSGDGSSKCFESSSPLLGQTRPCYGKNSTFTFYYGSIEFSNNSISQSCQSLSILQISRGIYTLAYTESLSSNFVSYEKPDNYGVLNSKGAIIGTLLGDGVMIKSQDGIKTIGVICLEIEDGNQDKYPILDFAIQTDGESIPKPLEIHSIFTKKFNDMELLCSEFSITQTGNPIYFPINRISNWIDKPNQLFDKTTIILMYSLAVLFSIIGIWGYYQLILIAIVQYKSVIKNFQLTHFLILIVTLFISIRSIYFFIMPSGILSNSPVSDYVLVVLPTFIYFTAFTILLSIWYLIVFVVLKNKRTSDNVSTRLHKLVFSTNALLYLLFIAIVLVFQYTKPNLSNDCKSRIVITNEISASQKAVSIFYAVVQGVISLIIGTAFIYLGGRLYLILRANANSGKSNHQRKIFTLTIACSIGFILHCAFVLVLVSANLNSIIFSFIGLVITEMVPAISILHCYDQRIPRKDKHDKNRSRKSTINNGKSKIQLEVHNDSSRNSTPSTEFSHNISPPVKINNDTTNDQI